MPTQQSTAAHMLPPLSSSGVLDVLYTGRERSET